MNKINIVLLFFGIILIIINIIGIFIPLRNNDIYIEQNITFGKDIVLTEKQFYKNINKKETNKVKTLENLNNTVNKGIAHSWDGVDAKKYNIKIPFYENYLLFLFRYIYNFLNSILDLKHPNLYNKYEFSNYKKAIERGVGLCSQHAIILDGLLKEKKIKSNIIKLDGHVVVTAEVDERKNLWWILDPDFGVIIKHNIHEVESNPVLVSEFYKEKGYPENMINYFKKIYGKKGNKVYNDVKDYSGRIKYFIEYYSYILIWLIPLFLISLSIIRLYINLKTRTKEDK